MNALQKLQQKYGKRDAWDYVQQQATDAGQQVPVSEADFREIWNAIAAGQQAWMELARLLAEHKGFRVELKGPGELDVQVDKDWVEDNYDLACSMWDLTAKAIPYVHFAYAVNNARPTAV